MYQEQFIEVAIGIIKAIFVNEKTEIEGSK
jgi:hypothetical protein